MKDYNHTLTYARRAKRLVHSGVFANHKEFGHLAFAGYMSLQRVLLKA
jgi:hypothetical protein